MTITLPSWSTWSIHYFLACTAIMSSIAALQYAYGSMKTRSSTARKGTRSSSKKAEEMTPEFKAFRERESSRVYGARVSAMVNVVWSSRNSSATAAQHTPLNVSGYPFQPHQLFC